MKMTVITLTVNDGTQDSDPTKFTKRQQEV